MPVNGPVCISILRVLCTFFISNSHCKLLIAEYSATLHAYRIGRHQYERS